MGGLPYQMTVGVVEGMSHAVVIGRDILTLLELVPTSQPVSMVVTTSQRRAQGPQESTSELESNGFLELPFAGEDIPGPVKSRVKKSH